MKERHNSQYIHCREVPPAGRIDNRDRHRPLLRRLKPPACGAPAKERARAAAWQICRRRAL